MTPTDKVARPGTITSCSRPQARDARKGIDGCADVCSHGSSQRSPQTGADPPSGLAPPGLLCSVSVLLLVSRVLVSWQTVSIPRRRQRPHMAHGGGRRLEVADSDQVHMARFEEGLGRIMFVVGALELERPFLGPLYRFMSLHPQSSDAEFHPTSDSSSASWQGWGAGSRGEDRMARSTLEGRDGFHSNSKKKTGPGSILGIENRRLSYRPLKRSLCWWH